MEYIKYEKRKNWTFRVVLLLLAISVIYAIYMLINAPSGVAQNEYDRVKSDYVLMILQCLTGCIVIFLPSHLEHRFRIDIPGILSFYFVRSTLVRFEIFIIKFLTGI